MSAMLVCSQEAGKEEQQKPVSAKTAGGKRGKGGFPALPPASAPAVAGSGGFLRGSTLELLSPDLSFCPPPAL